MSEKEKAEPSIKWVDSEAQLLLKADILEGIVPAAAKDDKGKSTMALKDIYTLRPEFSLYRYSKFSQRLSTLRAKLLQANSDSSSSDDDDDDSSNKKDNEDGNDDDGNDGGNGTKKKKKKKKKKTQKGEPTIKWARSEAKRLLYNDIREGRVPGKAKDGEGKSIMALKDIYALRPEFALYLYSLFSSRLSSLRTTVQDRDSRAALDAEAMESIIANHEPKVFSYKGYANWQYSEAQELLKQDLLDGIEKTMSKKEFWASRSAYYENYPLGAFRDKVMQEIRTGKYLHTLEVRGKDTREKKGRKV